MDDYLDRIIDTRIRKDLSTIGTISIEGPKGCGKTRTGKHFAKSFVELANPKNPGIVRTAIADPGSILQGEIPRLIDEWQTVPSMWDAIRYEVDERGKTGQFIMTGSSVPPREGRMHVGAGRFSCLTMRTMSLYESKESSGSVSLRGLFEGHPIQHSESRHQLKDVAGMIVRGGWPYAVINGLKGGGFADSYVDTICYGGISLADGVRRDPRLVRRLLRSVSRNVSTLTSLESIMKDMEGDSEYEGREASKKTIRSYYDALCDTFVVDDLPACGPSPRSRAQLYESPKRQLSDPSIAASVLGLDENGLMDDIRTFGFLFESLCDRDLRVYADAIGASVGHYHDRNDLEIDAIIEMRDGRWGAVEVKLTPNGEDAGAKNLNRLEENLRKEGGKEEKRQGTPSGKRKVPPAFKIVLTAVGYPHAREDGVIVVPIGCLGP